MSCGQKPRVYKWLGCRTNRADYSNISISWVEFIKHKTFIMWVIVVMMLVVTVTGGGFRMINILLASHTSLRVTSLIQTRSYLNTQHLPLQHQEIEKLSIYRERERERENQQNWLLPLRINRHLWALIRSSPLHNHFHITINHYTPLVIWWASLHILACSLATLLTRTIIAMEWSMEHPPSFALWPPSPAPTPLPLILPSLMNFWTKWPSG